METGKTKGRRETRRAGKRVADEKGGVIRDPGNDALGGRRGKC